MRPPSDVRRANGASAARQAKGIEELCDVIRVCFRFRGHHCCDIEPGLGKIDTTGIEVAVTIVVELEDYLLRGNSTKQEWAQLTHFPFPPLADTTTHALQVTINIHPGWQIG